MWFSQRCAPIISHHNMCFMHKSSLWPDLYSNLTNALFESKSCAHICHEIILDIKHVSPWESNKWINTQIKHFSSSLIEPVVWYFFKSVGISCKLQLQDSKSAANAFKCKRRYCKFIFDLEYFGKMYQLWIFSCN